MLIIAQAALGQDSTKPRYKRGFEAVELVLLSSGDNHVDTAQTDQSVNDAGEGAHVAQEHGNEVIIENTDKSPV